MRGTCSSCILSTAIAAVAAVTASGPAFAAGRGEPGPVFPARIVLRNPSEDLLTLAQLDIDVDAVLGGRTKWARVYVIEEEIGKLEALGFTLASPDEAPAAPPGAYYTYATMTAKLQQVAADHPAIVRLSSLGPSTLGRELWMMKISRNPDVEEDEPEVRYIAGMHGDEVVGNEMCIRFIDLLTDGYGTDPRVTSLVDANEIWILPSMNPDGTAASSRYNAGGVDLNRDFPDQFNDPTDSPDGRAPETQHVMNWGYGHATNLSANFHGGLIVARYPFDASPSGASVYSAAPEDSVLRSIARTYADANPDMATNNYDTNFDDGIANGAAWFVLWGGMMDWNYIWRGGRELTLEISENKWPGSGQLPGFWDANRESMLAFLERADEGVRGIVRDATTGAPLRATVRVDGVTGPGEATYTDPDAGDYHRLLLPGRYDLEFSALGYAGRIEGDVVVTGGPAVTRDVELTPLGPSLAVVAWRVLDGPGGDGALDAGETASLAVTVRNLGSSATGLSAHLIPAGWFATIESGGLSFVDLPPDASAESLAPHPVVIAASGTPAGHKLGFAVAWSSSEGSGVTEPFFVPAGAAACTIVAATDVPVPVEDRTTADSSIAIPEDRELSEVDVFVDIAHTYVGDLHVHAVSPAGTPVALHARTGGSTDDLVGWYDSERIPSEPLSRFAGESSAGTWTLRVRDGVRANTGTLRAWSARACGRPFEASIPELRLRDVSKTPVGDVVLTWWPYPKLASYRILRSSGPPAPGSFADVTSEDDDPADTRFEDSSAGAVAYWLVGATGSGGGAAPDVLP